MNLLLQSSDSLNMSSIALHDLQHVTIVMVGVPIVPTTTTTTTTGAVQSPHIITQTTDVVLRIAVDSVHMTRDAWPSMIFHMGQFLSQAAQSTPSDAWPHILRDQPIQCKQSVIDNETQLIDNETPSVIDNEPKLVLSRDGNANGSNDSNETGDSCIECGPLINTTNEQHRRGWKTIPCRFGNRCRGEQECFGYHGIHDARTRCQLQLRKTSALPSTAISDLHNPIPSSNDFTLIDHGATRSFKRRLRNVPHSK